MFDPDAFEERAAIMEFDGGVSRFRAETEAAKQQGISRWEAIGDASKRVVEQARNKREALAQRAGENDLSGMQPPATKED